MLLALPNFDQTLDVIIPILFQTWSKILSLLSNKALQSTHDKMRAATHENGSLILGCVSPVCYSNCGSFKGYTLYTVYIYISLFQIRKYSYIAYDNLF